MLTMSEQRVDASKGWIRVEREYFVPLMLNETSGAEIDQVDPRYSAHSSAAWCLGTKCKIVRFYVTMDESNGMHMFNALDLQREELK